VEKKILLALITVISPEYHPLLLKNDILHDNSNCLTFFELILWTIPKSSILWSKLLSVNS